MWWLLSFVSNFPDEFFKTKDFYRKRIKGNKYTELSIDLLSIVDTDRLNECASDYEIKNRIQNVGCAEENKIGFFKPKCMNHKIEFEKN